MTQAFQPSGPAVVSSNNATQEIITLPMGLGYTYRFQNESTAPVYIKFGNTASLTNTPVSSTSFHAKLPAGIVELFGTDETMTHVGIIGGSTVTITGGRGI